MPKLEDLKTLKRMHNYIHSSTTGKPSVFARKLGLSERHVYRLIQYLKLTGAPIAYDRFVQTYYYTGPCDVIIRIDVRIITPSKTTVLEDL